MRWMLAVVLCLLSVPCLANEEEAVAALQTAGVNCVKGKSGYGVTFTKFNIPVAKLKRLLELPLVRRVEMGIDNRGEAAALTVVKQLKGIEELSIGGVAVRDEDMKHVAEMSSLIRISIHSDITDRGLLELSKIKGLKSVTAHSDKVTQAGREKLNELLPKCAVR